MGNNHVNFIWGQLTMGGYLGRRFYPNYFNADFFFRTWLLFIKEDVYTLSALFGLSMYSN